MRRVIASILLGATIFGLSAVVAQQIHVVRPGENLSSIGQRYGLTLQEVAQANGITAPYIIHAGNQVIIPASGRAPAETQSSAQPASTNPTKIDNCCFVDRQCTTDEEWTSGYWAFQNGQCAAPAQIQVQTEPQIQSSTQPLTGDPEDINNCCHLDRECHTEAEWSAGWVAFKEDQCWHEYFQWASTPDTRYMPASGSNNCCSAPGWLCQTDAHFDAGYRAYLDNQHCSPRLKLLYLPYYKHIYATDNCCDLGRECHTAADRERGHRDFRYFRCAIDVPVFHNVPVHIQGNRDFVDRWIAAFSLLKAQSPRFYDYAIAGLNAIIEGSDNNPNRIGCVARCDQNNTVYCEWEDHMNYIDHESIFRTASVIVHEACHCHRDMKGYPHGDNFYEIELPCHAAQADLAKDLDPGNSFGIPWDNYRAVAREQGVTDLRY